MQLKLWSLWLLLAVFWCGTALAVPAPPGSFKVKQPDGTELTVKAFGDEFGLFFETEDGYTITQDRTTGGTWHYADRGSDGRLKPTHLAVGKGDPQLMGLPKHQRHDDTGMKEIDQKRQEFSKKQRLHPKLQERKKQLEQQKRNNTSQISGAAGPAFAAAAGDTTTISATATATAALAVPATFRLAVLLMEFPAEGTEAAVPHTYSPEQINELLFSTNSYTTSPKGYPVNGSLRDYYNAMSGGRLSVTGQVFPWVMADHGKSYYMTNGGVTPVAVAKAGVDLSQFDGYAVVFAGREAWSNTGIGLWPQAMLGGPWYSTSEMFYSYRDSGDISDIGVHCHEFGHLLGLTDLYWGTNSLRDWSVMASGNYGGNGVSGYLPVQMTAMEKELLGWLEPTVLGQGTFSSLTLPVGSAYKLVSEVSSFYLENRQNTGYDLYLREHGLTIYHVDMAAMAWTADALPYKYDIEESELYEQYKTFPGYGNLRNFDCSTVPYTPSSYDYNGRCAVAVTNIGEAGGLISFDATITWTPGNITIDGAGNYPTIFLALEHAIAGQSVQVPPGTYTERIAMKPGVNVAGSGVGKSILQSTTRPGQSETVVIGAADSTLSGFTLKGSDYAGYQYGQTGFGYFFENTTPSATISNCAFIGFNCGIFTMMDTVVRPGDTPTPLKIVNNLFTKNTTAVVSATNRVPVVANNIFTANSTAVFDYSDAAAGSSINYNILSGNLTDFYSVGTTVPGPNNLFVDPKFVNATTEDFHLQSGSPGINAGNPAVAYNDLDGSRNDMGVYGGPLAPLTISTASLPAGIINSAYSQTLAAVGNKTPFTWAIASGTLPTGLSLNSSNGLITGTPTATGTSSFTVQVTDASGATDSKTLSIAINAAVLTLTTTVLADGYLSTAYSQTLTATSGKTPYTWSITSGTLPTGLSLNSSSGAITGTPTATGAKTITFRVKDANNATASKSLTITVYTLPSISTTSLASGTTNSAYSATLAATGGKTTYSWSITSGTLPIGLSLNAANGAITGTPTVVGTSSVTFEVTDANGKTVTKSLSIVINAPAVTQLNSWTNLYSAAPGNTSATNLAAGSFTVGSGSNRLLLVAVAMETGSSASPAISAAYGGTALTPIKLTSGQRETVWVGYLNESQIGSGAKALTVTYSGATGNASALHVKWAAFSNVNQTTPVVSFGGSSIASTSPTFGTAVNYVANGMTTVIAANGGTPATGTLSATPSFTAGTSTTTNAQTSKSFTSAKHTAAGSYASTTKVTWSGTTSTWSALVAVSLQP